MDLPKGDEKKLPVGVHFVPSAIELINVYLFNWIFGMELPTAAIKEIAFYDFDPENLPLKEFSTYCRPEEAYFFTRVVHGRSTKSGQWRASGPEEQIMYGCFLIGFKRKFVFYSGEMKTEWSMKEYRVNPGLNPANVPEGLICMMDSYVVCKIQRKLELESSESDGNTSSSSQSEEDCSQSEEDD